MNIHIPYCEFHCQKYLPIAEHMLKSLHRGTHAILHCNIEIIDNSTLNCPKVLSFHQLLKQLPKTRRMLCLEYCSNNVREPSKFGFSYRKFIAIHGDLEICYLLHINKKYNKISQLYNKT